MFGIVFEKCSLNELDERTYEDRAGERRIFDTGGGPWKAGGLEGYHGQIYEHGVSNRVQDHVRPSGQRGHYPGGVHNGMEECIFV